MNSRIPITAAKEISNKYGYKQVVILARNPPNGGWITSYGKNKLHCKIAADMATTLRKLEQEELKLVQT